MRLGRKLLLGLVLAQSLVLAGLAWWWLRRTPPPDDGQDAFASLMRTVHEDGAAAAVNMLSEDVFRAGVDACHREACVAAIFNGDEVRWRQVTVGSGVDRCAGYNHPNCTRQRVAHDLAGVLSDAWLLGCEAQPVRVTPDGPVRPVTCRGIDDRIRLGPGAAGGYIMLGDPRFPGLLPGIYARSARPSADEASRP